MGALASGLLQATLVAAAILAALGQSAASANGRSTLVFAQDAGPYRVDVSILPARPVVGKTHLSILMRSLASGEIVTSADVVVAATGPAGSSAIGPVAASNYLAIGFFETDLSFDVPGEWQVEVTVSSELGQATALVPLQVGEGGGGNWMLLAAVAVVMGAAGVVIWGRLPRRKPRSRGAR